MTFAHVEVDFSQVEVTFSKIRISKQITKFNFEAIFREKGASFERYFENLGLYSLSCPPQSDPTHSITRAYVKAEGG